MLHVDTSRRFVDQYSFRVSPNGTQDDSIPNSGSGNYAWAGDWQAAAQRVPDGYLVELRVPFTTLRYPRGQTEFGIAFGRNFEREEEADYWPHMQDRFRMQDMAVLGPLKLRNPVNRPTLLPYGLFRADDDGATVQLGLDVKHVFPNDLTALFSSNPDFRNIEDVVDSIAYSDTPRLLDESRPFFREGSRFFPGSSSMNTRLIPDVTAGVKTFGEVGPHEFGVLGVLGDRGRLDGAFDYTYKITPEHGFGTGLVYSDNGHPTSLVSHSHVDGWVPLGRASFSYNGDFRHSWTRGPLGEGNSWNVGCSYGGDGVIGFNGSYSLVDPTWDPQIGYVGDRDTRGWSVGVSSSKRSQGRFIQNHSWSLNHGEYNHADGSLLQSSYSASGSMRLDFGWSFGLDAFSNQRPPNRDRTLGGTVRWGLETLYEEGGLRLVYGDRGGSDYFYVKLDQGWAPVRDLRLSLQSEYTRRDYKGAGGRDSEHRTQSILTATYELNPYSSVSARFIEREGRLNLFLAYRNAPTSGRSWYLFFGDPNAERTEVRLQAKVIWPL
ncbi:MAG: hypothetical protein IT204_13500 [Fimbriimonadaceae bacterium]|nr:hypothetical protein [Fimbriimonadaceae bacterium]